MDSIKLTSSKDVLQEFAYCIFKRICFSSKTLNFFILYGLLCHVGLVVSRGAVHSAASSYAAMHMVAGSRPVVVIAWKWHIGLALLCGCSGALEYPTTNSCGPINKSLSLSLSLVCDVNKTLIWPELYLRCSGNKMLCTLLWILVWAKNAQYRHVISDYNRCQ